MGNLYSSCNGTNSNNTRNKVVTQEQIDLKLLGNNYPFGDDELRILYTIYVQKLLINHHYYLNNINTNTNTNQQQQQQPIVDDSNVDNDNNRIAQIEQQNKDFLHDLYYHCWNAQYLKYNKINQSVVNKSAAVAALNDNKNSNNDNNNNNNNNNKWLNDEEAATAEIEKMRLSFYSQQYERLKTVQSNILPSNFSYRFYTSVFIPDTIQHYTTTNNTNNYNPTTNSSSAIPSTITINNKEDDTIHTSTTSSLPLDTTTTNDNDNNVAGIPLMDEYTRKAYLEAFFRGLAKSSRRGSRAAVKSMFVTCTPFESSNTAAATTTTTTGFTVGGAGAGDDEISSTRRVKAIELIDMGYRLALATAYLQYEDELVVEEDTSNTIQPTSSTQDSVNGTADAQQPTSKEQQQQQSETQNNDSTSGTGMETTGSQPTVATTPSLRDQFLPPTTGTDEQKSYPPVLISFANSLLERARSRCRRNGIPLPNNDIDVDGTVTIDDVFDWIEAVAPLFGSILPTFVQCIVFPKIESNSRSISKAPTSSRTSFIMPSVPHGSSDFFLRANSPLLYTLGCLSPALASGTPYYRLYASSADGLSFNRLLNSILGYSGPTLFIIRTIRKAGNIESIFGAYTSSTWKEAKDFFGNTDCFLYQLSPCTAVYRPTGNNQNYVYCNSEARSHGYDQQAHGIGFGGTIHQPRLFIDETFENCTAASRDLTFDNGHLLPHNEASDETRMILRNENSQRFHFDIDTLEVWGVGTVDTIVSGLQAREQHRSIANEAIRRARKVDKAQFLDDFRSGVIENKAFQHRQQIDGRADVDVDARFNEAKKNLRM